MFLRDWHFDYYHFSKYKIKTIIIIVIITTTIIIGQGTGHSARPIKLHKPNNRNTGTSLGTKPVTSF